MLISLIAGASVTQHVPGGRSVSGLSGPPVRSLSHGAREGPERPTAQVTGASGDVRFLWSTYHAGCFPVHAVCTDTVFLSSKSQRMLIKFMLGRPIYSFLSRKWLEV
jgi:hypothetical protein